MLLLWTPSTELSHPASSCTTQSEGLNASGTGILWKKNVILVLSPDK